MGIAGAAPPNVATRVGRLGLNLRVGFARALSGHRNVDAGFTLKFVHHGLAPLFLDRAIDGQRTVGGMRGTKRQIRRDGGDGNFQKP
jgi:hypothetical protein